jgi:hypothetical protein
VRQNGQRVRAKNTALRAKLSRSVSMPVGIACPVCGHLTMTIPITASLEIIFVQKSTGRLECAFCGCGVLGGASRTLSDRAWGSWGGLCSLQGSFLPAGSLFKRTLDVERGLTVGSVKTSSGRLTCFRGVQRDFQFAFTHGTIVPLRRKHSARRSPASRELALRVRSDFWVSLEPALPLF